MVAEVKQPIKHHVKQADMMRRWASEHKYHMLAPEFNKRADKLEMQIKSANEEKLTCFDHKKYKVEKVDVKFDRNNVYD